MKRYRQEEAKNLGRNHLGRAVFLIIRHKNYIKIGLIIFFFHDEKVGIIPV